jgi:hypothetical protein
VRIDGFRRIWSVSRVRDAMAGPFYAYFKYVNLSILSVVISIEGD